MTESTTPIVRWNRVGLRGGERTRACHAEPFGYARAGDGGVVNVFVTGGSGFVGGRAIPSLVGAGHRVTALARSPRAAERVSALGAEPIHRDLCAVQASDLAGVEAVVHAAAFVEEHGTLEQYRSVNVDGTRHLVAVARAAGARRFVHLGTAAVRFAGGALVDVDERHPYPARQRFPYSATKAEAERIVLGENSASFATISLRPRFVWGPGDLSVLPTIERTVKRGGWMWLDGGRHATSTAHVDNVAQAIHLALERGRGGQAYFIADAGTVTLRAFLTAYLATVGVVLPERNALGWFARPAARLAEGLWGGMRWGPPPLVAFSVCMMSRTITVQIDKARADLGYVPQIDRESGLLALGAPDTLAKAAA
jgi:nucleoside-diphosphate-sugar epimerase